MLHAFLIVVHAVAGVAATLLGLMALPRGRFVWWYVLSLVVMAVTLTSAVAVGWGEQDSATRVVFAALIVLAAAMVWQGELARRGAPLAITRPDAAYVQRIGFTLVSLVDAFVVVAVLNSGAPIWAVVLSGVVVGMVGHLGIRWARRRFAGSADLNDSLQGNRALTSSGSGPPGANNRTASSKPASA